MSDSYLVFYDYKKNGTGLANFTSDASLQEFLTALGKRDATIKRGDKIVGGKLAKNWWFTNELGSHIKGSVERRATKDRPIKHSCRRVDLVNTSRYSDAELLPLIELARGAKEHGHVALSVKNSRYSFRGRAYPHMPTMSNRYWTGDGDAIGGRRFLVVAAIGAPERFPIFQHRYPGMRRAPQYDVMTWQEGFVMLVAHELTHCQQFALGLPRSEIEAEKAAVRALEAYRASLRDTEIGTAAVGQP